MNRLGAHLERVATALALGVLGCGPIGGGRPSTQRPAPVDTSSVKTVHSENSASSAPCLDQMGALADVPSNSEYAVPDVSEALAQKPSTQDSALIVAVEQYERRYHDDGLRWVGALEGAAAWEALQLS